MKAMVLPKKQLLYVLKKQGFKSIGEDHCNQKHSQPTDSLNLKESDSFIKEK